MIDDAIKRARAYIEAGTDGIMIHSRQKTPNEIFDFCKLYNKFENRKPLVVVPSSFSSVTEQELIDQGVNVVIYANHFVRGIVPVIKNIAETILENGRAHEIEGELMSISDIIKYIPKTFSEMHNVDLFIDFLRKRTFH